MQPRTREERHFFKHKENLEKERLRNRTGNFFRYEEVGNPMAVAESCPGYVDEKERHVSGAEAINEKFLQEREIALDKRNARNEVRRAEQVDREEARWDLIEKKDLAEQDRLRRLIEDDDIGKKNVSGVPYNIVTLDYAPTLEGRKLKHSDDMCRYREQLRKANLAEKEHLGYNPLTGEQIFEIPQPMKPAPFDPYASNPRI